MHRALVHENDILRFQLNDLISREKNQVTKRKPLLHFPLLSNTL